MAYRNGSKQGIGGNYKLSRLVSKMFITNIFHNNKHNLEKQTVLENTGFKRIFGQKRKVEAEGWK
jgi:hypothetical protein